MAKSAYDKEYTRKLKEMFLSEHGADRMSDDELLGFLLSFTNCDEEIETTVMNIRDRFGSCRRAYMATYQELMAIEGVTHHAAVLILLTASLMRTKSVNDYVGKYVTDYAEMFSSVVRRGFDEELWGAAISEDGRLIAAERLAEGTALTVSVNISKLLRFASLYDASKIVIAHSHTDGSSVEASYDDIESARRIDSVFSPFGIRLIGQVIISGRQARYYELDERVQNEDQGKNAADAAQKSP